MLSGRCFHGYERASLSPRTKQDWTGTVPKGYMEFYRIKVRIGVSGPLGWDPVGNVNVE
jgi:hypothetical protein